MPQPRDPICSAVFKLLTAAPPAAVWSVLTCPRRTADYLHGLATSSTWEPGGDVEFRRSGLPPLRGRVLLAEPPESLAYTIEDASGATTYLHWAVRPAAGGSVLTLSVHEPAGPGDQDDLDEVWLVVVERLREVLAAATPA